MKRPKRPTTRDKFDNFVDKFDNFANHGGIIFLGVVLIICIYFFSYRQLPVIDLRDKEVEIKPRIEQMWKNGCEEKTFFCKYANVNPTKTYSVEVKLSQYGATTKSCLNTATYTIAYKPKRTKGYMRVIIPLSDTLRKNETVVKCYYECDFTFLEELEEE